MSGMARALKDAMERIADLPESDQEEIARELNEYMNRLKSLRADLDEGIKSLKGGKGKTLDVEDVIARARRRNAE
jgi:hypothetical protein